MRKPQENKFTMIKTVDTYLDRNQSIVAVIPELQAHHNHLKSKSLEITLTDDRKKTVLTGKTLSKENSKQRAIKSAIAISGGLYAYAKKMKNDVLRERVKVSHSTFEALRDTELVELLKSIKDLADEHLESLAPFGITIEKMNTFTERINLFNAALGDKEDSGVVRAGAVKSLHALFKEAGEILDSLDKIVNGFNDDNPDFVRDYYIARNIKNLGIRHRKEELPANSTEGSQGNQVNLPENSGGSS